MKATLEFSLVTKSEANQREHWAVKAKRVKKQRTCLAIWWRANLPLRRLVASFELNIAHKATVALTRVSPRALDDDNLRGALKAIRDQVADELGLRNDRDPRVAWLYRQERGKPGQRAVRIEVELVEAKEIASNGAP